MHKSYINVIISCLLLLSLVGCSKTNLKLPMQEEQPFSSTNSEETISSESIDDNDYNFSMTMLDVGQGLSLLIESDGEYMLYDGGGRNYSSYVVAYLKQHDVNELK